LLQGGTERSTAGKGARERGAGINGGGEKKNRWQAGANSREKRGPHEINIKVKWGGRMLEVLKEKTRPETANDDGSM